MKTHPPATGSAWRRLCLRFFWAGRGVRVLVATQANARIHLAAAILGINWVAPVIVVMLLILARRARVDEDRVLERARSAGEPI